MKQFANLPKLQKGDQVAVISPSAGLPGLFPWVQDYGLDRLHSVFGLVPKEYPTTRVIGSSLEDRARDIMAAFADPDNKAVFTSIGGNDQIKLIKLLDPSIIAAHPKPFFGYSDNTHLHNFLWNLGIRSYYGGAIMTQLAMQTAMWPMTTESLQRALFETGEFELPVGNEYADEGLDWSVKENLQLERRREPNDGLYWDGTVDAEGVLWGGCVESLLALGVAGKYLPTDEDIDGAVLVLETAEDIPEHWIIEYLLTGFGERGWFDRFTAVLVGRPKAWEFDKRNSSEQKAAYRAEQREMVIKTVRSYNQQIPIVQNIDFGHTDPQVILPFGNKARVQASTKRIFLTY